MDYLQIRIPTRLKRRFMARCEGQGKTASEVLRHLMAEYASGRLDFPAVYTHPTREENPDVARDGTEETA